MKELHEKTSCGARKSMRQAVKRYYIYGKEALINKYKQCENCDGMKSRRVEQTPVAITSDRAGERIVIDLTFFNGVIILAMICHFSKMAWTWIISSKEAKHVKAKLRELKLEMEFPPVILQADNGKKFTASRINDLVAS
jgi:hypothetical protein